MKLKFLIILFIIVTTKSIGQTTIYTKDIENFYQAFDSVQTTNNNQKQIDFVQKIYLDNGTLGIKYAIDNSVDGGKKATAKNWADLMQNAKENLIRIRPYLSSLPSQASILNSRFKYFKEQYPNFKNGNVYFFVGLGMFGGRPVDNNVFVGSELYANEKSDWGVYVVIHEFVHTLQNRSNDALLAHCLNEGACDFITEVISQKNPSETFPTANNYIDFGYKNEKAIWTEFKKFIKSNEKGKFFDWLYGNKGRNINDAQVKDLGYFIGYKICKAYYDKSIDKKLAIKEIIEMDVSTDEKARTFLLKSGYAPNNDTKFLKTFKFAKVEDVKKGLKLIQYGYRIEKENVVFKFTLPKNVNKSEIEMITIAGSFNGWNPKDLDYKMTNTKENIYELKLPKSKLKDYNEFKFVINSENWQTPPENAKNSENGNLTLKLK